MKLSNYDNCNYLLSLLGGAAFKTDEELCYLLKIMIKHIKYLKKDLIRKITSLTFVCATPVLFIFNTDDLFRKKCLSIRCPQREKKTVFGITSFWIIGGLSTVLRRLIHFNSLESR